MIGNRVRVIREGAESFEGVLLSQSAAGVTVHQPSRIADYEQRLFIPYARIVEIQDLGRAP